MSLLAATAVAVVLALPGQAVAQESNAEYTTEQQKLNERGVRAIISKDYALAIALLEESAAIGELNVTYLNLGRAYQKLGECKSARAAYERAKSAPAVRAPSPDVIDKKLEQYTAELATECEAKTDAALAQAAETADEKAAKEDTAKEDTAKEDTAKEDTAKEEAVAAAGDAGAEAGKPAEDQASANTEIEPAPTTQPATSSVWGWTITGTGVAVMGAGVGALFWADSLRGEVSGATRNEQGFVTSMTRPQALEHESRATTLDAVGIGMTIGGALLTTGGLYMLLAEDGEAGASVSLRTGADRLGFVWTTQF